MSEHYLRIYRRLCVQFLFLLPAALFGQVVTESGSTARGKTDVAEVLDSIAAITEDSTAAPDSTAIPDSIISAVKDTVIPQKNKIAFDGIAHRYSARLDSLKDEYHEWEYTGDDLLSNPYYINLFSSPTLYKGSLRRIIGSPKFKESNSEWNANYERVRLTDLALVNIYGKRPYLIETTGLAPEEGGGIRKDLETEVIPITKLSEKVDKPKLTKDPVVIKPDWEVTTFRPNFWTFKADVSLRFMQNYISSNWYQGGESNNSLLGSATLEANYDNKRKITFSNKLEMKLGFYSSRSDTIHKYKTNSDLLRMTNKLGVKATKHWYYTFMLQSWTQFYRSFRSNNRYVYSDFMSPFENVASIGMDYKFTSKNKKFNVSATLSPFAHSLKYVGREKLITSNGLDEGKHHKSTFGSTITANATWQPIKNVTWKSRLYFFTDYTFAKVEWENTFLFKINDFLSTELFLYPRFDDSVKRKEGKSYTQFKEYISLGFGMSF